MGPESSLEALLEEWLKLDRNETTREHIRDLWTAGKTEELEGLMRPRLEFGTAGLRGPMRAGWAGLNDLMVVQTCQGIGQYAASAMDDAHTRGVVIGYDHRHNSQRWAEMAAESFVLQGFKVYILKGFSFTPLVPFAVTHLRTAIGCMITASHNPGGDNGIKIYWDNGVQIVAPHDEGIAAAIIRSLEPKSWELQQADALIDCTTRVHDAYFSQVLPELLRPLPTSANKVRVVHTSLHGVAEPFMRRAFALLGDAIQIDSVPEQREPDPDFPTTVYPNPEEKGALNCAMAYADKLGVRYIFANDPDADRFCVAEKDEAKWRILTGNELGVILAAAIVQRMRADGVDLSRSCMITTVVSSKMLQSIAASEGLGYAECLTGFKNIGNLALAKEAQGFACYFGYEEALGYAASRQIKDKDGISAALIFAQLLVSLQHSGHTLHSFLESLYTRYGYFASSNSSIRCNQASINSIFYRIRGFDFQKTVLLDANLQNLYPQTLCGMPVIQIVDMTIGYDSGSNNFVSVFGKTPGQMVQLVAEDKSVEIKVFLTIRASGTEPKVKYYLETTGSSLSQLHNLLKQIIVDMSSNWLSVN
ncbi:Phosphoglucomutase, first 3 domain-containing protein [Auricularia subglabra TFB-10046 SS5]|nr:Phosphoglucomutase, first 3 domain-containing protein [Auricularia subglabra TFB-10046 SS5]